MSEDIWLNASVKFRKATWADFEPGDTIYYQMRTRHSEDAHGPMMVVNPIEGTIKNAQNVTLKALDWNVQLLKVDLVSLLVPSL